MLKSIESANASTSIVVYVEDDNNLFALSHYVLNLLIALAFPLMSTPFAFLKSAQQCSTNLLSKSSPPKCVSPAVALTSKIPLSIVRMDTSKVPPPKSKINTFFSLSPYL